MRKVGMDDERRGYAGSLSLRSNPCDGAELCDETAGAVGQLTLIVRHDLPGTTVVAVLHLA